MSSIATENRGGAGSRDLAEVLPLSDRHPLGDLENDVRRRQADAADLGQQALGQQLRVDEPRHRG
jgi:hypothetical protein